MEKKTTAQKAGKGGCCTMKPVLFRDYPSEVLSGTWLSLFLVLSQSPENSHFKCNDSVSEVLVIEHSSAKDYLGYQTNCPAALLLQEVINSQSMLRVQIQRKYKCEA